MEARCQCGQLEVDLPEITPAVVACHCLDCQRRTGSPLGVLAYYPADQLRIAGETRRFDRPTADGGVFSNYFCPDCGSTLLVKTEKHPDRLGVAVGAVADPNFPPPVRSVWEQSRHPWLGLPDGIDRFARGRKAS